MKHINVLYIDDEEINLEVFKSSFRKMYTIFVALSAKKGFEILDKEEIHVIIADQRMPETSGVSFFEKVKVKYPDTIRIILTAYADYHTAYESINRGFVFRFLQKPWSQESLINTIEDGYKIYSLTKKNKQLLSQYQFLFDNHTMPVIIVDEKTHKVIKVNECAKEFFSFKLDGIDIKKVVNFDDVLVSKNETQIHNLKNSSGENRKVILKTKKVDWEDESCYLVSFEDQTELIEFEKSKLDYMSRIQDKERKQLSMELHD
ncbi:MAG: response regulator, partial [Brumimicrobium sp.]